MMHALRLHATDALLAIGLSPASAPAAPGPAGCGTGSWIAGTVDICAGELVYRDYVYDDYGAQGTSQAPSTGSLSNPTGTQSYPAPNDNTVNNYADIAAIRLRVSGGRRRAVRRVDRRRASLGRDLGEHRSIGESVAVFVFVLLVLWLPIAAAAQDIVVTARTKEAVQAAIDSCPRGYVWRTQTCRIRLPPGLIQGSWTIGGDTRESSQINVCLIGHGPGGGTTLDYDGPSGGIVIDAHGGDYLCLRDISIALEGAAIGIRLYANNARAATLQSPFLERVSIRGSLSNASGTAIQITGAAKDDQVDALLGQSVMIYDVDVGIEVDSGQSVVNRIGAGSKISADLAAVRIKRGSLSLDGVLTQCRTPGCCTYDLRQGVSSIQLRVRDGHHQIGTPPASNAKLVCLRPLASYDWHVVSVTESYVNVQCDSSAAPCSVDMVSGATTAGVTFRDLDVIAGGGSMNFTRSIRFALEAGYLVWSGVNVLTFPRVGVANDNAERVRVEAIRTRVSPTPLVWNDLDLDGAFDAGEPTMLDSN